MGIGRNCKLEQRGAKAGAGGKGDELKGGGGTWALFCGGGLFTPEEQLGLSLTDRETVAGFLATGFWKSRGSPCSWAVFQFCLPLLGDRSCSPSLSGPTTQRRSRSGIGGCCQRRAFREPRPLSCSGGEMRGRVSWL